MMSENFNSSLEATKELDELIKLAEVSAERVDSMIERAQRVRLIIAVTGMIVYIVVALAFWMASRFLAVNAANLNPEITTIISGALAAISFFAYLYWVHGRFREAQRLSRDVKLEREVLDRVISLIHDQLSRVTSYRQLSAVMRATFEIRVKRLDRAFKRQ
jgi:hypothetical protein